MIELRLRERGCAVSATRHAEPEELVRVVQETQSQFAVVAADRLGIPPEAPVLTVGPRVTVLGLDSATGGAFVCQQLGDVDPDELVEAISRAAARPLAG
jgi:hypothetical protein